MPSAERGSAAVPLILLLLTGVGGLLFVYEPLVGGEWDPSVMIDLIMLVMGVLAFSLGWERASVIDSWYQRLQNIEKSVGEAKTLMLESRPWTWCLVGNRRVYLKAADLISQAKQTIQALSVQGALAVDRSFDESLIGALIKGKEEDVRYTSTYVMKIDGVDLEKTTWRDFAERLLTFKVCAVHDRVETKFMEDPKAMGFDVLMVDRRHAVIGVPVHSPAVGGDQGTWNLSRLLRFYEQDEKRYTAAIVFQNQPELVSNLVSWYQRSVDLFESDPESGPQIPKLTWWRTWRAYVAAFRVSLANLWQRGFFKKYRVQARVTKYILIVLGAIGVLTSLFNLVVLLGLEHHGPYLVGEDSVRFLGVILLMSGMCFALGLERLFSFPAWDKQLRRIDASLDDARQGLASNVVDFDSVSGDQQVNDTIRELLLESRSHIRVFGLGRFPFIDQDFMRSIADTLVLYRDKGLRFSSLFPVDLPGVEEDFWVDMEKSVEIFRRLAVDESVDIRFVDRSTLIGLGLLIVDTRHVLVSVADPRSGTYRSAVVLRNEELLAERLQSWFDMHLQTGQKYGEDHELMSTIREKVQERWGQIEASIRGTGFLDPR